MEGNHIVLLHMGGLAVLKGVMSLCLCPKGSSVEAALGVS